MFQPIRTERLLIRQAEERDAPAMAERRSDPDVARYQAWEIPYPLERAQETVADVARMEGPENDEWWMASVCDPEDTEVLGDLVVHLSSEGRTAEIGYTFSTANWGHGFAVEGLEALIPYLFDDVGVTRIFGMLHPDNPASAMVMERCGFEFEGHTRSSFWLGDDNSDDWIYGLTRDLWESWRSRPRGAPAEIRLVEVTSDNQDDVAGLRTHKTQERFVASVLQSYGDALFPEVENGLALQPWLRAIEADGELAGFVMLAAVTEAHPEPILWRFLIDRAHQRRKIGKRALDLVADAARSMGATTLATSWVEGKGSPAGFYTSYGFVPTGRVIEGEIEARLNL